MTIRSDAQIIDGHLAARRFGELPSDVVADEGLPKPKTLKRRVTDAGLTLEPLQRAARLSADPFREPHGGRLYHRRYTGQGIGGTKATPVDRMRDIAAIDRARHNQAMNTAPTDKRPESTIGERIIYAYRKAGLNRNQFAKAIGTTYANVMRWEKGATPGSGYIQAIAELTGVTTDWLLGRSPGSVSSAASDSGEHALGHLSDAERLVEYVERDVGPLSGEERLELVNAATFELTSPNRPPMESLIMQLKTELRHLRKDT